VIGRGPFRVGVPSLLSLVCVLSLVAVLPAAGQVFKRWPWRLLQERLKSEHEKVVSDSDRIVVLTRNLRHEVEANLKTSRISEIKDRARELEAKALELQEAVVESNENFLSVPVIRLAEEIRGRAQSLRKIFEDHPAWRNLERFRLFCREIEQRADAVRKRASSP